jgi:methionyl-tRNA formyltransferase
MSFSDNALNYILSQHHEVLQAGGLAALLQEPPLKICIFGSYERGAALFKAWTENACLKKWGKVVGVVTDDPEAQPWLAKNRIWQYPEVYAKRLLVPELVQAHNATLPSEQHIPLYTGRIKDHKTKAITPDFADFLQSGQPHLAFMGTFGQLLTQPIIDRFALGFLNFHPTGNPEQWPHPEDVGPQPFESILGRNCPTACLAMHWVSSAFDAGPLEWFTEPVSIPDGATPALLHQLTATKIATELSSHIQFGLENNLRGILQYGTLKPQEPQRPAWGAHNAPCASRSVWANQNACN